jgi:hypothetical protein
MSAEEERSLEDWIAFARVDAERRGLPELKPLLGGLLAAVRELRAADWNDDFSASAGRTADGDPFVASGQPGASSTS